MTGVPIQWRRDYGAWLADLPNGWRAVVQQRRDVFGVWLRRGLELRTRGKDDVYRTLEEAKTAAVEYARQVAR